MTLVFTAQFVHHLFSVMCFSVNNIAQVSITESYYGCDVTLAKFAFGSACTQLLFYIIAITDGTILIYSRLSVGINIFRIIFS